MPGSLVDRAQLRLVGYTPWDAKKKRPYQHECREGWNGKTQKRGIRVYQTAGRASKASPSNQSRAVFVEK